MPTTYKAPGVFIEEISKFPPSIAPLATAVPAFIGYTAQANLPDGRDLHAASIIEPVRIVSLLEYEEIFGGAVDETGITVTINQTTDASSAVTDTQVLVAISGISPHNLYYAMRAYFANGGGPCYVVSVGASAGSVTSSDLIDGLDEVAKEDEVTLLACPEALSLATGLDTVYQATLNQCGLLQDRFAILDLPEPGTGQGILDAASDFRDLSLPLSNLKYGAVYAPNLTMAFGYAYEDTAVSVSHNVTDSAGVTTTGDFDSGMLEAIAPESTGGDGALYRLVKTEIDKLLVELPPSALVAGKYAEVDRTRGVWKAPANVVLSSVLKPNLKISTTEQEDLNVHSSGKSINAIRAFTGKGVTIWGARTLDGNSNEWRYIPVRRFFNFAEESIQDGTERFVFEPNDANTWTKVRATIENFLTLQWRAGALAGAKPEQAFFVKVGLNETMTALDILEGRMIVEIGMAAVRPAEFIILRFSHKMQEA